MENTAESARWREVLPPVVLGRVGSGATVAVHVPDGAQVRLRAALEGGGNADLAQVEDWTPAELVDGARLGRARFSLAALPAGRHTLVATIEHAGQTNRARAALVVAPERHARRTGRGWGLSLDLHAVRSARSWGIGDWADLADLATIAARAGADFLQLNARVSPERPDSPFPDPIHIRPEDIREVAYLPSSQRTLLDWSTEAVRPANSDPGAIDLEAVWQAKRSALETIHGAGRSPAREEAFAAFRERGGDLLREHARARAAAEGGSAEAEEFHTWLAWIGTEQATGAQRAARVAGMSIGILASVDLAAVDTGQASADRWPQVADRLRMARRVAGGLVVHLPEGLDAELYPALAETELTGLTDLVEAAVGDGLAVIEGPGAPAVPTSVATSGSAPGPGPDPQGEPTSPGGPWRTADVWNPPEGDLPPETLAGVVVDTIPSAGLLAEEHIDLAERLGLLEDAPTARLAARTRRERMVARLREQHLVPREATERQVIEGLYRSLVRTPARLIAVALADAVGERRPQAMAGAGDSYPSGRVPLADGSGRAVLLEDLPGTVRFTSLLSALTADLAEIAEPGEPPR